MRTRGGSCRPGQLPGGGDAVHTGHANVHEDDVGFEGAAEADGFGAVGRGTDDGEVGLGVEQFAETGADHLVVVGDEDPDLAGLTLIPPSPPAGWPGRETLRPVPARSARVRRRRGAFAHAGQAHAVDRAVRARAGSGVADAQL